MMNMGRMVCVMVVLAVIQSMFQPSSAAITCTQVVQSLGPCATYITGSVPQPAPACCTGITTLRGMATTTPDKRFACNCVKTATASNPNIRDDAVSSLPGKCGVQLPYAISRNFDCNS
ncbi:hypothetical protein MKX01_020494 [Papaver californicum]|nr:hypothetical protein MKX01_020494 [Papaver californicum]